MQLKKLMFVETRGAADAVIRTFDTDIHQSDIDRIVDLTDQGKNLTPARMARALGTNAGIITPSTEFKLAGQIDNGYGESRIMFAMVVEVHTSRRSSHYEYIVGFTDKAEHSMISGHAKFDPDMRLYFNSITRINMTETVYRGSTVWQPSLKTHDQILNRAAITGSRRRRSEQVPVSLRPSDLFNRKGSESHFGQHLRNAGSVGNNTTGSFSQQLRASTRENNDPTRFLTRSIDAYSRAQAKSEEGTVNRADEDRLMVDASDASPESCLDVDPFLESLREYSAIMESGYVTFGELMDNNPDFDQDRHHSFQPYVKREATIDLQGAADWNSDSPECIAATIIAQSLPVIMMKSMYSKVDNLVLTTRTLGDQPRVLAGRCSPFIPDFDPEATLDYFETTVEQLILETISHNGLMEVEVTIDANIDQDIEIWISLDGGEEHYFAHATFADSFSAPTLGSSMATIDTMADNIVKLAHGVRNSRDSRHPNHVDANAGLDLSTTVSSAREERDTNRSRGARPAW